MNIKKTTGKIIKVTELSPSAREIEIKLAEPLEFIAGSFVNIFMDIGGEKIRRAYSISSSDKEQSTISLSIRLTIGGKMTGQFWKENILGSEIELMGPLGLNTAEKMQNRKKYLFGFGIGAGVAKSLSDHFINDSDTQELILVFGHKYENEILYKKYFDNIKSKKDSVYVSHVISRPTPELSDDLHGGYIQDHISEYDFNNSDIYICGQEKACEQLKEKIADTNPVGCSYFIEGFH